MTYKSKPNECPSGCPKCGSKDVHTSKSSDFFTLTYETKYYHCIDCDFKWQETWKFVEWEEAFGEMI